MQKSKFQEKKAQGRRKAEVVIKVKMANESHWYPKDHYEIKEICRVSTVNKTFSLNKGEKIWLREKEMYAKHETSADKNNRGTRWWILKENKQIYKRILYWWSKMYWQVKQVVNQSISLGQDSEDNTFRMEAPGHFSYIDLFPDRF